MMKTAWPVVAGVVLIALGPAWGAGGRGRAGKPPVRAVTICKQTYPPGAAGNFSFAWSNGFGALPSFTVGAGQCVTKDVTNQDAYNKFTEAVPPGWLLTSITCNNVTSPVKFTGGNNDPAFQYGDNTVSIDVIEPNVTCTFFNQRPCVQRPAGMVSWWRGDANASDSIGGFNGTASGVVSYTPGMVAQAFNFTSKGYIEVADNPAHIPTGSFTVDAWVKPHGFIAGGRMTVVSKYECGGTCLTGGSNSTYQLEVLSGNVNAVIRDTDAGVPAGQTITGPFVADGQWHHLAMVRDVATTRFFLYVDGALVFSTSLNAGADSTLKDEDLAPDPLYIGARKKAGPSFQAGGVANMEDFFVGLIDEVEYFNRALTGGEIASIYNAGGSGKCKK